MSETWKRQSGWAEEGDDGLPSFGRKARAWFVRKVRAKLGGETHRYSITSEEIEGLVQWYGSDPIPYVEWQDGDEYRGRGWSSGAWTIDWDKVNRTLYTALDELRLARDTAGIKTLDDWLKADLNDSFEFEGVSGGTDKLPKKLRRELKELARARRKKLPHICQSCREEFTPTSNRAKRCTKCMEREPAGKRSKESLG